MYKQILTISLKLSNINSQLIPVDIEKEQLRTRPWITISGIAINPNQDTSSFDLNVPQFTHANRPSANPSVFPVLATIPTSPRFSKKPIPKPNTYVSIQGFLTRYIVDQAQIAERFCIEVENVVFLGRPNLPAETPGKYS